MDKKYTHISISYTSLRFTVCAFIIISTMPGFTKAASFNPASVTFKPPRTLDNGGKIVYVSYSGSNMILQIPEMYLPYGCSELETEHGIKYSAELSFKGEDGDAGLKSFHDKLRALDEYVVQQGIKNSLAWFKKKNMSEDVIRALYTPLVRCSKDKETGEPDGRYPDTFRLKLQQRNGEFECKGFDSDKQLITEPLNEVLAKGARVKALIQCSGVWFAGGKFGMSFKALQMKITPPANLTDAYAFDDSDDEDDTSVVHEVTSSNKPLMDSSDEESPAEEEDEDGEESEDDIPEPPKPTKAKPAPPQVDLSDDSESESDDDIPEPPKPKVTKKKVVKKSKKSA